MDGPKGDQHWVQTAVDRYQRPLLGYALRIVGNEERARDVVQETFAKLVAQRPGDVNGRLAECCTRSAAMRRWMCGGRRSASCR